VLRPERTGGGNVGLQGSAVVAVCVFWEGVSNSERGPMCLHAGSRGTEGMTAKR